MKKSSSALSAGNGKVSMSKDKLSTGAKVGGDHDHKLKIKTKGSDGSMTKVTMKSSRNEPKGK